VRTHTLELATSASDKAAVLALEVPTRSSADSGRIQALIRRMASVVAPPGLGSEKARSY